MTIHDQIVQEKPGFDAKPSVQARVAYGLGAAFAGWVVVRLTWRQGEVEGLEWQRWSRPETIARLPARTRACVDIPIGLQDWGSPGGRSCDHAARKLLGSRSASVFSPPLRPALRGTDLAEAQALQRAHNNGVGLGRQTHSLLAHIRALDDWITPERQAYVRETHPELVFLAFNRGLPLPGKRTPAGRQARMALLAPWVRWARLETVLDSLPGKFHTDVIDAVACAVTAMRLDMGQANTLGDDSRDSHGLLMQISY